MTRFELYCQWREKGVLHQVIKAGLLDPNMFIYLEWFTFYEKERKKKNYHARKATCWKYAIDISLFKHIYRMLYKEIPG